MNEDPPAPKKNIFLKCCNPWQLSFTKKYAPLPGVKMLNLF